MLTCKCALGSESIKRAMDRVHITWAGIIKHSPGCVYTDAILDTLPHGALMVDKCYQSLKLMVH